MFKSVEFGRLFKYFLFYTALLFVFSGAFSLISTRIYHQSLHRENAKMISILVDKYPGMEEDIIKSFQLMGNANEGYELLDKYGININTVSTTDSQQMTAKIFFMSFGLSFLALLVIAILSLINLWRMYQKLEHINTYINAVLNDREYLDLREYKEGVFSTLKNDVYKITNKLNEQKEQLFNEKKYLETTLSDISHQIKTPLTSIYVLNNLLEDSKLDPKVRSEFVRRNEMQLERMEWLVSSLLKLSRLESGVVKLKREKINLYTLLKKTVEPISISIELKKQTLDIQGKKNIFINCDSNWTTEALVNIVKNAYEHTSEGGEITLSYTENPIYVELFIKDNGEGMSEVDINHVFERFYKSSLNTKDSIGIGLNMSKLILMRQNATIDVQSKKGIGTTFVIRFFKNNL